MSRRYKPLADERVTTPEQADRVARRHKEAIQELQGDARKFALDSEFSPHALGSDKHKASTLSALNELVSDATLADVDAGTWEPKFDVGGTVYSAIYTDQDGWYLRVGETVVVLAYARRTLIASSDTISITNLPFTPGSEVEFWPAWVGLCALAGGDVWARCRNGNGNIYINDVGDSLGTTSWTFSSTDVFASVGAIYKRS